MNSSPDNQELIVRRGNILDQLKNCVVKIKKRIFWQKIQMQENGWITPQPFKTDYFLKLELSSRALWPIYNLFVIQS